MKAKLAIAVAGFMLGVPGIALAAQQYPQVDFASWTVRTFDGRKHTGVAPHTTFKHCKSNPAVRVSAIGNYKNAKPGTEYRTFWYVDDAFVSSKAFSLGKTHGTARWSLFRTSGNPIPDGRYDLHLTQSGHRFAETWIKLATRKKHGKPC